MYIKRKEGIEKSFNGLFPIDAILGHRQRVGFTQHIIKSEWINKPEVLTHGAIVLVKLFSTLDQLARCIAR